MIKKIFSSSKGYSSKRIIGALCIFLYICILIGTFWGLPINPVQESLLTNLLYVGAGLIGAGVLDRFSISRNDDNPNSMTEN